MTLASASSAIIVYALELVPGRIGMVAGLFFGLSFGMAGIGAAVLGRVADATSIATVYQLCAFLPAIGLLTALLPDLGRPKPIAARRNCGRRASTDSVQVARGGSSSRVAGSFSPR